MKLRPFSQILAFRYAEVTYTPFADALVFSALPTILVSCKCDNPVNTRQIDTESIEAACLAEVETVKTAANVPESARLCLGAMLRAIMANRIGQLDLPPFIMLLKHKWPLSIKFPFFGL
jgi:hypothetical protein